jgi:anti-sigma-K factor RskA
MTDDELHSQAHLYVVGALEPDEARTFEAHLAGCADCRKEVAAMNEVTAHLSESVAAEPPAGLRSSVLAQIAGTAQDPASAQPAEAPVSRGRHAGTAATVEPHSHAPVVPLRRPWRDRTAILVAAAAVVAAVGVGGWAINERNDARDQAASAQRMANELTAILSAGDAQTVTASTQSGAVTSVVRSSSRGLALLLASDLPALPAGKTYQAWTIDDDKPTSAGIFESQGAQTIVELPAAAVKTSTVAISVERAGGAETPSAPIVALGLG